MEQLSTVFATATKVCQERYK